MGSIKQSSVQEVLDRVDIVEVVGNFLNLKKRGANYLTTCPFHYEKTPSFNVNPARGIFKCFGCGKGGDAVSFLREYEKFSFIEAIRWLATFYHIELEVTEFTDEQKAVKAVEESLRAINDFANQFFQKNLWEHEEGKVVAGQYFQQRGLTEESLKKFELGYAVDEWEHFYQHAKEHAYQEDLLEKSGLIKERNGKYYDAYRGRVIFPIKSSTGSVLGFGARILTNNTKAPKYINSPESELYVKNRVLYGLYEGRRAIAKENNSYLVEGYMDVIAMHQAGVENVVASSGTALTPGQLKLIKQISERMTFIFDGDAAGIAAATRGLNLALEEGLRVYIVPLPPGEDPDSLIKEMGAEAFQTYLKENEKDFISYRIEQGAKDGQEDPIIKSNIVNDIALTLSKIKKAEDFTLQSDYIKKTADAFEIDEAGMVNLVNQFIRSELRKSQQERERELKQAERQKQLEESGLDPSVLEIEGQDAILEAIAGESKEKKVVLNQEELMAKQLIKLLLNYGSKIYIDEQNVAQTFFENIAIEDINHELAEKIATEYYEQWSANGRLPHSSYFVNHIDEDIKVFVVDALAEEHIPSDLWEERYKIDVKYGEDIYEQEVKSTFAYFELKNIRLLIEANNQLIKECDDENMLLTYMQTHLDLKKKERELIPLVIMN